MGTSWQMISSRVVWARIYTWQTIGLTDRHFTPFLWFMLGSSLNCFWWLPYMGLIQSLPWASKSRFVYSVMRRIMCFMSQERKILWINDWWMDDKLLSSFNADSIRVSSMERIIEDTDRAIDIMTSEAYPVTLRQIQHAANRINDHIMIGLLATCFNWY